MVGVATRTLAFWVSLFVLLLVPVEVAIYLLGGYEHAARHPLGLLAMIGLLAVAYSLLPPWPGRLAIALVLVVALFVRLLYLGVAHFSGAGFTQDFFIHLEWESVQVAWDEYRWLIIGMAGAMVGAVALCAFAARRLLRLSPWPAATLGVVCLGLLGWARAGMPEWQLLLNAQRWYAPVAVDLDPAVIGRWRASGLVEVDLLPKRRVVARAPESPRNLILLYLESVGRSLVNHPDHPGLMPFLGGLMASHALVPAVHHSSYITIEGLVNSQCGTLFGFERGSEALLGYEGMADELPCLGDVLRTAGYRQVYLGGADMGFAGKGEFLRTHGYDVTKGQRHWATQGIRQRPGTWGVSDADLFGLAFAEMAELRADGRPFNLTLLTIGSHLPGYRYRECLPYRTGGDRFLDAVHCTDQLLKGFVERLQAEGHLDDTLLVITADHHIFRNHQMRQTFGDAAVEDRRLPFVVMGAGADRRAAATTGAGYDLAPTVLDLLDIAHNARFALGRSLLRPDSQRNYFVTRYETILDGVAGRPARAECDRDMSPQPPLPPLDSCDKAELAAILRHLNAAYSPPLLRLTCEHSQTRVLVPADASLSVEFAVSGTDISGTFLRHTRPVAPTHRGLFLLAIDGEGQVLDRSFSPAGEGGGIFAQRPQGDGHHAWLLAWRDDDGNPSGPPSWLDTDATNGGAGAWLLDAVSGDILLSGEPVEDGILLEIAPDICETVLGGSDVERSQ